MAMSLSGSKEKNRSISNINQTMDPTARNFLTGILNQVSPFTQRPQQPQSQQPASLAQIMRNPGGMRVRGNRNFANPFRGSKGEAPDMGGEPGEPVFMGGPFMGPMAPSMDVPMPQVEPSDPSDLQTLLGGAFETGNTFSGALDQADQTMGGAHFDRDPSAAGFDAGNFFGMDPGAARYNDRMAGVEDSITAAAQRAVGDQFSLAGRTGSPAQAMTLGKTVARELAPYQFGAAESQADRQSSAFQNERQRQLSAAMSQADRRSSAFQNERQRQLAAAQMSMSQFDPISQFQRFTAPLIEIAGLFPNSISQSGHGSTSSRGVGLNLFGG